MAERTTVATIVIKIDAETGNLISPTISFAGDEATLLQVACALSMVQNHISTIFSNVTSQQNAKIAEIEGLLTQYTNYASGVATEAPGLLHLSEVLKEEEENVHTGAAE